MTNGLTGLKTVQAGAYLQGWRGRREGTSRTVAESEEEGPSAVTGGQRRGEWAWTWDVCGFRDKNLRVFESLEIPHSPVSFFWEKTSSIVGNFDLLVSE